MTGRTSMHEPMRRSWHTPIDVAILSFLALVPYLLHPGKLTSDTKLYLHTNPIEFLGRVPYLWDRQVAAGTVSHQHVGYLFPMGPFFGLADAVGLPDWVAQRLWWSGIAATAGIGMRWLALRLGASRLAALSSGVVYILAPYQLTFTVRLSVLLLPFAVLPWMVGHALRGVERGGWREPAWLALLAMSAGAVNLSALLLAGIAPAVAIAFAGRGWRSVASFVAKVGALTVAASAWWLNGLRIQGRHGLPILGLTENVQTIAEYALPSDIIRGFGNWLTYGREPDGSYSLAQTEGWTSNRVVVFATLALPALAIAAALVLRWRHRATLVAMMVVGTIIGAGAWPIDRPRVAGRTWRWLTDASAAFAALRNTPRVVPVITLAVAALLAAAITAARARAVALERLSGAVVLGLALVGFAPVWSHGATSEPFERAETPNYWSDLADALEAEGNDTRVLEIPGTNFAVFRWGNAIDPLLPALTDRPYLSREVLPYGTVGTVDLLDAFERRLQLGTFEPSALAPIARLFGAGTIVVRNDLDYGATVSPHPDLVWGRLADSRIEGLSEPIVFGDPIPESLRLDPIALDRSADATIPPAAIFDLTTSAAIVDAESPTGSVLVVGDGDGLVDSAAAGLVTGDELVVQVGALTDNQLAEFVAADPRIVITDSNRKRYRNFFSSIAATVGPTETPDEKLADPYGYDIRPDVFEHDDPADQTYVVQTRGRATATRDGGSGRPENRAAVAFDGDPTTAWRIDGATVAGERLRVELDRPEAVAEIRLLQALDFPRDRSITGVKIRVDGGDPISVELDQRSFRGRGQIIPLDVSTIGELEIEIASTTESPVDARFANPVGFAEVSIGRARVVETLVVPDVFDRRGVDIEGAVDFVFTRQRVDPRLLGRGDEEARLARSFTLARAQRFEVTGNLAIATNADDTVLDTMLGTGISGGRADASSHLQGSIAARSAGAFDGDPTTRWTSAFRPQVGEWIELEVDTPIALDAFTLSVLADGRHQVPTRIGVSIDGRRLGSFDLPNLEDGVGVTDVPIDLGRQVLAQKVRITLESVRPARATPDPWLPVSLEVDGLNLRGRGSLDPESSPSDPFHPERCRDDVLLLDGEPLAIRPRVDSTFELCGEAVELGAGEHTIASRSGAQSGIDVNRLVLRSATSRAAVTRSTTTVEVLESGRDSLTAEVTTDGEPFWFVLRESFSDGWQPSGDGLEFGPRTMVDGYANGWLVTPDGAGEARLALQWTPQRTQWVAFAVSSAAIALCAWLVLRRRKPTDLGSQRDGPTLAWPRPQRVPSPRLWRALFGVGIGSAVVGRVWVAVIVVATTIVGSWLYRVRIAAIVAAPGLILLARVIEQPDLVWVPLAWLVFEVTTRSGAETTDEPPPTAAFAESAGDSPL